MKINDLIKVLEQKKEEYGNVTCCHYDSGLGEYTENLCLELVTDDYYIDKENKVKEKKFILF